MAKFGWNPGRPDFRDLKFSLPVLKPEAELPKQVDMRGEFPDPYDQMQLGSCTANACAGLIERESKVSQYKWPYTPSRLFIYFNTRMIEGTVEYDSGASIRDTVKAANAKGVCPESDATGHNPGWWWTYSDDAFKFRLPPFPQCFEHAKLHKALKYESVSLNRLTVLNALASEKPFMFGFTVYESFEDQDTAKTGVMKVPGSHESVLGGHAVVAVGYKLDWPVGAQGVKDWVIVRNSWSSAWGDKGYFLMPLDQVMCNADMTQDAWNITVVGYAA